MSNPVYLEAALRVMPQALEDACSLPGVSYPVVPGTRINALDSYIPEEYDLARGACCGLRAVLMLYRATPGEIHAGRADIYNLVAVLESRYRIRGLS